MKQQELLTPKKKKKKRFEEIEIEEEGMYPIHERYTKEGIVKE